MWRLITILFGALCGAPVGLAAGLLLAFGAGWFARLTNPSDPSAGAVAIIGIFTGPAGMLMGTIGGGMLIDSAPEKFVFTILPLAILIVGLSYYNWPERPATYRPPPLRVKPQPSPKKQRVPPAKESPKQMQK